MRRTLFALLLSVLAATVSATQVQYSLSNLGGSTWQYRFTLTHDGSLGGAPLRWFSIGFATASFADTSLVTASPAEIQTGWNEVILPGGPGFPAHYDVFATGGGIAAGNSVAGFTVRVNWLGSGTPTAPPYEIIDPTTLATLEQGTAQPAGGAGVPIPTLESWALLALLLAAGLIGAGWVRRFAAAKRPVIV